ncbi:E1 ubiquitin-activating protein aos1, partial [Tieghemiomyces parasiticus]
MITSAPIQPTITADEAALYDRQIRLWGLEAQQRLRNAHVRVINLRSPIALELCKNLTLAGIGRLTLTDDRLVETADLAYLYCCLGDADTW